MSDTIETPEDPPKFDFSAYPEDTLFYDRRTGLERRADRPAPAAAEPSQRRQKKDRRKRIDPTTFEKQYTPAEIEFMTAMQRFKVQTGKAFPSHAEVLGVARSLGYRRSNDIPPDDDREDVEPSQI